MILVSALDVSAPPKVPPTISSQPQSLAVVTGDAASFSVTASGTQPLYYQWRKNGTPISGATAPSYYLATVTADDAASYDVVVSNAYGTATSSTATLTVWVPPAITGQPQSLAVVAGSAASFGVTASGTQPLSYQWRKNGVPITGATAASYSLAAVTTNDAAGYDVVVSNAYGTATSSTATLTVWVPPAIAAQPQSRTNLLGTDATFSVTASGQPPPACQWHFNGITIPGATGTTLLRSAVSFADAGGYRAVLTNLAGAVTSAVATLTIVCPPVTLSPATLPNGQVGNAYSQSLTASGGLGTYTFAVTAGSLPMGLSLSSAGVLSGIPGAVGTGSFTVRATDTNGCFGTQAYSLVVTGVAPAITLQPQNRTNVLGTDASFSVTAAGTPPLTYQWQFNSAAIPGATGSNLVRSAVSFADAGGYRVVVTNRDGAVTSAVATLTVICPLVTLSPASLPGGLVGSAYSQTLTASGGVAPYSYAVVSGGLPTGLTLSGQGVLSGTLLAVGNFSFTIRATDASGCSGSRDFTLAVTGAAPAIALQPQSCTSVAGTVAIFSVVATGASPLGYRWQYEGVNLANNGRITGATTDVLQIADVQTADAGAYSVVVSNAVGMVTSAVATLTVVQACIPAVAGLVGWWPGDGNANDIAGGSSGTLLGGATANGSGLAGSSFTFDGTNGYVQVPDAPALRPTNLTVEAWVLFSSLDSAGSGGTPAGQQYIVFKQNTRSSFFEGYYLGKARIAGGDVFAFAVSSALGQLVEVRSTSLAATGIWYHVVAVRGSNFVQLYVNGNLESQASVSFAQDYGNYPLYFGTSGQTYWDRKLNGRLDEVSLYNRALSSAEVAAVYQAGSAGKCKAPTIVLQPQSQGAMPGSNALFTVAATGFGALSYQWRFNGTSIPGATGTNLSLPNVQPTDAGSYTVVVTNSLGSVISSVATLTVWVPPAIGLQPQSRTNILGTDASFSVTASGTLPLAYQWQHNGAAIAGATGSSLVRSAVGLADAGGYRVVVTNVAGAVTSAVATLTVVCPAVTISPVTLPAAVVGSAYGQSLTASGGFGPYTFAVTAGTLPDGLSLSSAGLLQGTPSVIGTNNFTATATDTNACSGSQAFTLPVTGAAPVITLQPLSRINVAGTTATFTVGATGTTPLSYQWRFNGSDIGGATGTSLLLTNVQPTNAGSYAVVVTNVAGSMTSAVATLTVVLPSACVPAASGLVGWWPGEGNANDITGGNSGTLQGGATAGATGVVGSAFGFDGTNGYVSIPDAPILRPTNLTIEAWVRFDSLDSPARGGSPAGDQYLVFKQNTDAANFEGFALMKTRLGGSDFFDFLISAPGGQSAEVPSVSTIATGVWYHVAGVRGSNYLQLYVNGQLEGQVNASFPQNYGNYPLCFGSSGQPTYDHKLAGTLDEVTLYSRALSSNEIAAVYAAQADGKCKPVSITAQPQSRAAPVGSNVTFSVVASGSLPLVYQWQRDSVNLTEGGNVAGALSPTLSLASVALSDAASYRVIIGNTVGAVTSAVAVLTVVPALTPPTITNQPASQTVQAGTNITFTVGVSGTAPLGYQWRFNGTNLANAGQFSGVTNSTLSLNFVLPANAGSYSVVVTNGSGSVTSAAAILAVTPPTSCVLPPAGLVGWWPGDGNARDIVGTNNGALMGGATANAPAVVGTGFSLDGTNRYVEIPDAAELKPAELTVECWVKWHDLDAPGTSVYPGQQYIVFKQNSRSRDFEAYVLSKDRTWDDIILWEVTSDSGELIRIDSTSPVTTNVWYHLAAVRGSNYIQLYFNGVLEAQASVTFPQDYGDWPLYFGTSGQAYYDRKLNGVIDEVLLYNRALSAGEIATLYASGLAGKCKGTNGILITVQPQSQSAAPGSNATFAVVATGDPPMTYQWLFNGGLISGATSNTFAVAGVQAANAGSYKVVIANPTGTKISADAILTVGGAPLLLNPRTTAQGAFAATVSGTPGHVYLIEVTTNFLAWATLTSVSNATALVDFIDSTASNGVSRAYRARLTD